MDSSITAYFGGDTSNLRQATQEASIMMKGFSTQAGRAINEIGQGFIGAVVFMEAIKGIKEFASAAMDAADAEQAASEISGAAVSDQAQAWLDLAAGADDTGFSFKELGMSLVSWPLIAGGAIGTLINDMRGISPEMQQQWTASSNAADAATDKMKAAFAAAAKSLPEEQAKANAQLAALNIKLANDTESTQDKITDAYDAQVPIINQINDLESTIAGTMGAQIDPAQKAILLAAERVDLTKAQVALAQNEVDLAVLLAQATKEEITADSAAYEARSKTQTTEQNLLDLSIQIAYYTAQETNSALTGAQQLQYKDAAMKDSVKSAAMEDAYQKSIALSVSDQLDMFRFQTGTMTANNAITSDQYNLLVLQSQEKKAQVDLDQQISVLSASSSQADKDHAAALDDQNNKLLAQIALLKQVVSEEQTAANPPAPAPDTGPVGAEGDPNDGAFQGGGTPGGIDQFNDPSEELSYLNATVSNVKGNLQSSINDLESQKAMLVNDPFNGQAGPQITAINAKIDALHQQLTQVSTGNLFGGGSIAPIPISTSQGNQQLLQLQSDTLTKINSTLTTLVSPTK